MTVFVFYSRAMQVCASAYTCIFDIKS